MDEKPTTVKDALKAALKLIRRGWVQEMSAAKKDKSFTPLGNAAACKWCATGAIRRVLDDKPEFCEPVYAALARVLRSNGESDSFYRIVQWNDARDRTKAQIVEGFQKAIRKEAA
jgi:hypothetical protein